MVERTEAAAAGGEALMEAVARPSVKRLNATNRAMKRRGNQLNRTPVRTITAAPS
ncbi:MAG TPA: hypothetical protein VFU74_11125 [Actinocrinis sp.]|nr:hypothetical protein [Actinocrinis sp.]